MKSSYIKKIMLMCLALGHGAGAWASILQEDIIPSNTWAPVSMAAIPQDLLDVIRCETNTFSWTYPECETHNPEPPEILYAQLYDQFQSDFDTFVQSIQTLFECEKSNSILQLFQFMISNFLSDKKIVQDFLSAHLSTNIQYIHHVAQRCLDRNDVDCAIHLLTRSHHYLNDISAPFKLGQIYQNYKESSFIHLIHAHGWYLCAYTFDPLNNKQSLDQIIEIRRILLDKFAFDVMPSLIPGELSYDQKILRQLR